MYVTSIRVWTGGDMRAGKGTGAELKLLPLGVVCDGQKTEDSCLRD